MGSLCTSPDAANTASPLHDGVDFSSDGRSTLTEQDRVNKIRSNRKNRDNVQKFTFAEAPPEEFHQVQAQADAAAQKCINDAIKSNELLHDLSPDELRVLIDHAEPYNIIPGTEIITQEGQGDFFYVIQEGTVDVKMNGHKEAELGPGRSFGEIALLTDAPRNASVISSTKCSLWRMDRMTFRFAMASAARRRTAVAVENLRKVKILASAELSEADLISVASSIVPVHFKQGMPIMKKGEEGHIFYMIEQGEVLVKEIGENYTDVRMGPGEYFGERALESQDLRTATVVAATDCVLQSLVREDFEKILGPLRAAIEANHNRRILESTEFLHGLSDDERTAAVSMFIEHQFAAGDVIVREGEVKPSFFIIKEGLVAVHNSNMEGQKFESLGPGRFFNSEGMQEENTAAAATCTAEADTICFELRREDLESIVTGDLKAVFTKAYEARMAELAATKQHKVPKDQLQEIAVLGQGTFGRVKLVQDTQTQDVFALKVLHKKEVVEYRQHTNVMNEKNIMLMCHHPFILQLHNTYKDDHRLYLLLEFCNGGELFTVLHTRDKDGVAPGPAKFYCGCVALALAYLLERNIMYRDLKPENMLVDAQGYVKIIDFGFAKIQKDRAFTLCGTPEYMAPEIILSRGYDISVDWWALGVLIYECLAGYSPFAGRDQNQICQNIVQRKFRFEPGKPFNKDSKDLISSLLELKPAERLVSGPSGASAIKNHPWFTSDHGRNAPALDWHVLIAKNVPAPWVPKVKSATDTANYEGYGVSDEVDRRWRDPNPGWDADF